MYEQIVSAVIGSILTVIGGYVMLRVTMPYVKKQIFLSLFDEKNLETALQMAINNEKFQKFLYEVGGLVAAGAKGGFGLSGGGGKPKIENILLNLAGQYLGGKVGLPLSTSEGPQQAEQPLNRQSNKVGY